MTTRPLALSPSARPASEDTPPTAATITPPDSPPAEHVIRFINNGRDMPPPPAPHPPEQQQPALVRPRRLLLAPRLEGERRPDDRVTSLGADLRSAQEEHDDERHPCDHPDFLQHFAASLKRFREARARKRPQ